ncbi:NAD(P)-binding protein [Anaeromyces robustus]|jgi:oxidoreductase|uniref:NAD(P)-binding protein n=1 Tax=Anaeromyces robustus TaxID=1754192 RepID=A0A1Y1XHF9_9FUNG|nr:NAD(P)-binding protein [Anaeromyces robustus]|eukprot:ORX85198.1 NAD(P)-binding protein [Anaeromyces robustus]
MSSALVIGSTGATGIHVIGELLKCGLFEKVTSVARSEIDYQGPNKERLVQEIVDFEKIEEHKNAFKGHTHMFSCFGTTRKLAGSAENFVKIDHDYVINATKIFKEENPDAKLHYILLSSGGANAKSPFLYMKTKGQIEDDIKDMKFSRLSIFRPGSLLDRGHDSRLLENVGCVFAKGLNFVTFDRAGIPVTMLGKALVRITQLPSQQQPNEEGNIVEYFTNKEAYELAKRTDIPGFENDTETGVVEEVVEEVVEDEKK